MTKADDKVDAAAAAARVKSGQVIDDVADLATRAAAKAGRHVHASQRGLVAQRRPLAARRYRTGGEQERRSSND